MGHTVWERDGLLREEKLELKLSGLGGIRNKCGSIRTVVDDGWSENGSGYEEGRACTPQTNFYMHPHT